MADEEALRPGERLGPYQILGPLGAGGMGKVFRALDTRLDRAVAIKISSEKFSQRFEREARAISALNHPNVCTLYDVGSLASGSGYMVTELVEGETLRDWLKREAPVPRRIEVARQVLEALRAAHGVGIVHRDLKPANIMVRRDGYVKVLDFGLAKRIGAPVPADNTATMESLPGQMVGTAAYMSPEQIQGHELDARSDLFAFGIILYEMLAGRHPWRRDSPVETLHAILYDKPERLESEFGAVVESLLQKDRAQRYSSAQSVLEALVNPPLQGPVRQPALTRLIVLPFRLLRRHEASDFLAISLPDAISSSLAAIDSLVVRSTLAASRFAGAELDLTAIAEQAQVDAVLTGTILSDGEHLRVSTQLVRVPDGTLLWSTASQIALRDVFQLQDNLVERIVQALAAPLSAREQRDLKHDVPASAISYELYLRANQLAHAFDPQNWLLARDLYLRSVEADPKYAPAWACLGRIYRIIGKYGAGDPRENLARAEEAFQQAFTLNSDLALAHNYYTSLQTDLGRHVAAMERLLKRAYAHGNDPNLFAALVHACRHCGLLEASVAAHNRAKQLDPNVRTTAVYTHVHLNAFEEALGCCGPGDEFVKILSLIALDRKHEAVASCLDLEKALVRQITLLAVSYRSLLEGQREKSREAYEEALGLGGPFAHDPEGFFWIARDFANLNEPERAFEFLSKALDKGYCCHYALLHDPWLEPLRPDPRYTDLVNRAGALQIEADATFLNNGGPELLGTPGKRDSVGGGRRAPFVR